MWGAAGTLRSPVCTHVRRCFILIRAQEATCGHIAQLISFLDPYLASQLVHVILFNVRSSRGVGRITGTLNKDGNSTTIQYSKTEQPPNLRTPTIRLQEARQLADANESPPANGILQWQSCDMLSFANTDAWNPTKRTALSAIMMLNLTNSIDVTRELCFLRGNLASDSKILVTPSLGIALFGRFRRRLLKREYTYVYCKGNPKPGRGGSQIPP